MVSEVTAMLTVPLPQNGVFAQRESLVMKHLPNINIYNWDRQFGNPKHVYKV